MKRSWRSSIERRSSASRSAIRAASTRRRACQTMARNIAAISGTSNSSPHSWMPRNASRPIDTAVIAITPPSTMSVHRIGQTRKPYRSVRLIQTKWNGIVSQLGQAIIAA